MILKCNIKLEDTVTNHIKDIEARVNLKYIYHWSRDVETDGTVLYAHNGEVIYIIDTPFEEIDNLMLLMEQKNNIVWDGN